MKTLPCLLSILALGFAAWLLAAAESADNKAHKLTTVSTRKLADSLQAVIAADRQVYVREVVQRLAAETALKKTNPDGPGRDGLPAHARMLRMAATDIQKRGAEFSYTLRSLWPIHPGNGPQTDVEKAGLEFVARNGGATNFYTEESLGGRSYFTAIYADKADLPACVECHNQEQASPRQDFKLGDVMGAIVVRVPLEF